MEELKKKTEAMLRAVLISSPRGIPLRRVDREYKSITFSPIPFTQLGFRNLEDYLRSIPHVASFTRDSDGELVLRGVASEADKHVAKLISKQKKPKLRKSAPARRPVARSRFYSVRTPTRPNTRPQTQPLTRSSHPPTRTQSSAPSLSTAIFGPKFEIPPRMKKVLQRNLDAASSNKSSRVVTIVKQPAAKVAATRQPSGPKEESRGFGAPAARSLLSSRQQKTDVSSFSGSGTAPATKRTVKTKKGSVGGAGNFQDMVVYLSTDNTQSALQSHVTAKPKSGHVDGGDNVMFSRITQILVDKPKGLWATRLPIEYKNKFNEELPDGIVERLQNQPQVAFVEMPIPGKFLVYPPRVQTKPEIVEEKVKDKRTVELVRKRLEYVDENSGRRIIKVLGKRSKQGISSRQFNVDCVTDSSDKRIVEVVRENSQQSRKSRPLNMEHVEERSDEASSAFESFELKILPVPEAGSTVGVYVSHIDNVGNFFVHLKDNATQVDELQQRLNEYFQNSELTDGIVENIRVGLLCCAQFTDDDSWYRARIIDCIETTETQTAQVVYIDFGNKEYVPKGRLRRLKKQHADTPMMSVKCSLDGVESVIAGEWKDESTEKFRELTGGELTMTVIDTCSKDDTLLVQLTDASGQDIGSVLVNEGLACTKSGLQSVHSSSSSSISSQPTASPPEADQKKPVSRFRPRFLSSKSQEEKKEIGYAEMPADEFVDVFVFNILSTDKLFVHVCSENYSDNLALLEKSMLCYFADSQEIPPEVAVGYLYALFSKDIHSEGMWYRVKVLSLSEGQAKVEFVDYRETAKVLESDLRVIPTRFLELPFQAFTLALNGIPKSKNPEVIEKLKSMALGKLLVAEKIKHVHDTHLVELYDTSTAADININTFVRELIIPDEDLKPTLPKPGKQIDVFVTYFSASGQVFVQVPGAGATRLEELMNDITEHYSKATKAAEFVKAPYVGKICCAKCSDHNWYRARITELLDRKVVVEYVDYGNTETIPSASLREPTKANEHVSSLPFQAIECQLFGVAKEVWNQDLVDKLVEAGLTESTLSLEVVEAGDIPLVNLYFYGEEDDALPLNIVNLLFEASSTEADSEGKLAGGERAVEEVKENGSAGSVDGSEESPSIHEDDTFLDGFPTEIELSEPWVDLTVTDIVDPGHFTFQPLRMLMTLEVMVDKMTEFYQNAKRIPFKDSRAGVVCAAYHSEYKTWYRAIVKAVLSSTQICIRFADYGDLKIVPTSSLQPLADAFKELPFFGLQASMAGVRPCDDSQEWSDECLRRFEDLVLGKMLVAKVADGNYRHVYAEDRKIPLEMFDTSKDSDVSVADVLIKEGHAKKSET